jgi:hypothetical protein
LGGWPTGLMFCTLLMQSFGRSVLLIKSFTLYWTDVRSLCIYLQYLRTGAHQNGLVGWAGLGWDGLGLGFGLVGRISLYNSVCKDS